MQSQDGHAIDSEFGIIEFVIDNASCVAWLFECGYLVVKRVTHEACGIHTSVEVVEPAFCDDFSLYLGGANFLSKV